MFPKKSSRKRRQKSPSCLFFCFNGSAVADSGDLEAPPAAALEVAKKTKKPRFFSSWSRRKKKPLDETETQPVKEKMAHQRGCPPARQKSQAAVVEQVIREGLIPKYQARSQSEPSDPRSEPKPNQLKRGEADPTRRTATLRRVKTMGRSGRIKKLDPQAGLLILGMTLAVMVFYGRAAAVVNLCSCLYLTAILRWRMKNEAATKRISGAGDVDVGSEEYKKRVVLEGLLKRSKPKGKP